MRPTKPVTAGTPSSDGGVHDGEHEVVLLAPNRRVLVQHVVEVADVGDRDTGCVDGREHTLGPDIVEGLAQIERVRDGVEHRFGRHVGERRVQCGGQLDAIGVEGHREVEPFLDGQIGIRVASLARRELLQRGGEHADRHELRFELLDFGHRGLFISLGFGGF